MSLKSSVLSWILVALLSLAVIYQYIGANKAEQKAADAEAIAKDLDAKLKDFTAQSAQREAAAQARFDQAMQESANLRAILAKGSQAPPRKLIGADGSPVDVILKAPQWSGASQGAEAGKSPANGLCEPFMYQGKNLTIASFPVAVCDQHPVVDAEAAVQLEETQAKLEKSNTDLAEVTTKLALEDKDLVAYKQAEIQWKKAAHKSRIKRVLNVAEKVGLFAAGIYIGHKF